MSIRGTTSSGHIVILNGVPRSGKTSIARAVQARGTGVWVNLGVDASQASLSEQFQPGIGLRPGAARPDLEPLVAALYAALFESVAAHARSGLHVVVDVGLHDDYSVPRHIARDVARKLHGLSVLFVGVRCPVAVVWDRRRATWGQDRTTADGPLIAAVERWQTAVHVGVDYDLEVDTSVLSPAQCADAIAQRLDGPPGTALHALTEG